MELPSNRKKKILAGHHRLTSQKPSAGNGFTPLRCSLVSIIGYFQILLITLQSLTGRPYCRRHCLLESEHGKKSSCYLPERSMFPG